MLRFFLSLVFVSAAVALSAQATVFSCYEPESVKRRIDNIGPAPIEGLWKFTSDGATVAIERVSGYVAPDALPESYNVVMVEPVDDTVVCGTLIGRITPTALESSFDCTLFSNPSVFGGRKSHRFTIQMNDDGHISFMKVKSGVSVSLWRWIPYLFRVTVVKNNERNPRLDGAIRVYPVKPSTFNSPRYL